MLLFDAIYGLVSLSTPISLERRRSSVNDGQAKPLDVIDMLLFVVVAIE